MYELERTEIRATSVSTNSENMGESGETRLGLSIYIEYRASNEALDDFDPKLRPALYESAANDAQQDFTGHLPNPKFKFAKPICWPYVGAGYTAIIHPQFDVNDEIEIDDVKIDKFQFTIEDEGVVVIKHRLYFHPTLEQVGPLCSLEKHDLTLSLIAPKIAPRAEADDEEESPQQDMLDSANDEPKSAETDVLYRKAVAVVRATKNPDSQALMTELRCSINDAARMLQRMIDDGVIRLEGNSYVVVEEAA